MKAIAAMDQNRVIGNKGEIPWHIPADFKWFKSFTMDKTLIVGRTTFETLPSLKNRDIVVLTTTLFNVDYLDYIEKNKKKCRHLRILDKKTFDPSKYQDAIVIGGAKTYESLLPICDELYMTYVINEYDGDTFMPPFENLFNNSEIIKEERDFWIVKYWKDKNLDPNHNPYRDYNDRGFGNWETHHAEYVVQQDIDARNKKL
jgi:dihydrofolate reductase